MSSEGPQPGGHPMADFMRSLADVPLPAIRGRWNEAAHPAPGPRPVRVPISVLDTSELRTRAEARSQAILDGVAVPTYGDATPEMSEVGILGEDAVTYLLRAADTDGVLPIADLPDSIRNRRGDVAVRMRLPGSVAAVSHGIEVKTARVGDWKAFGKVLHPKHINTSAVAFVWCVIADELPTAAVMVMGWVRASDVRDCPDNAEVRVYGKPRIQVAASLRSVDELVPWLREKVTTAPPF